MGTILLLIFLIFFVVPAIRIAIAYYRIRRQSRKVFDEFQRRAYGGQGGDQEQNRKAGWSGAPSVRKKIDPRVGEYVKFEELDTPRSPSPSSGDSFRAEPQVTDVDWEDIPDKK